MKAVIDTNVVFAGLANSRGAPFKIFQRFFEKQFTWIISQQILDEYYGVLTLSEKISPISLQIFLYLMRENSLLIPIDEHLRVCKDPDDNKFLETAIAGNADFLVTKNLKHFPSKRYQNVRIVKVSTFLTELEKHYPT